MKFTREDESQTVRFDVTPCRGSDGRRVPASRRSSRQGATPFSRGYQVIEYPHIRRAHIYHDAEATLKVIDVKVAPNLTVGYIMGVGDEVPPALEQLGARRSRCSMPDDLAWGNLSRFTTIVTGVRAYERRAICARTTAGCSTTCSAAAR